MICRMHSPSPHSSLCPTGPAPAFAVRHPARTACRATAALGVVLAGVATAPAAWVALLVIAPVLEEIVFRAGLQEQLLRRLQAKHAADAFAANALTAFAFAAAHLAVHASVLAALTAVPALLIGHVYQQQRRLAPCIALHALFNAIWLLWAGAAA
jgi:membrane protease YdiL (CAAX protease family)